MGIYCNSLKTEYHGFLFYLLEIDKENDNRNALTTPAVVHRRRKPKRRSTGVVHIDMEVSK